MSLSHIRRAARRIPWTRTFCAAVAVLGASLAGGAARAEPPRGTFGGASIWFGTNSPPTDCGGYCSRVWGPALEGSLGQMINGSLAIRGDLWLYLTVYETAALGAMVGPQLWLGARASLRASVGAAGLATHNADGGPGFVLGGAVAITGSYQIWRAGSASAELQLRGVVIGGAGGSTTAAFAGYALGWD